MQLNYKLNTVQGTTTLNGKYFVNVSQGTGDRQYDLTFLCSAGEFKETVESIAAFSKKVITILVDVIKEQKKQIDYNGYYCAYLQGQIDEEQFNQVSLDFAYEENNSDVSSLLENILILRHFVDCEWDEAEISSIFKCSIEKACNMLNTPLSPSRCAGSIDFKNLFINNYTSSKSKEL